MNEFDFACHGSTDHADPSNSGLILQRQDGQDRQRDRLTVQRVSELSLSGAHIAYLSACSTAENKAERLSDEVIHVVSGFQVDGFPHVVGCLWPSMDRICVEVVADGFYQSLFQPAKSTPWEGREGSMCAASSGDDGARERNGHATSVGAICAFWSIVAVLKCPLPRSERGHAVKVC